MPVLCTISVATIVGGDSAPVLATTANFKPQQQQQRKTRKKNKDRKEQNQR